MTTNPLDLIQARADAATKGPWRIENDSECDYEAGIPYSEWPQTLIGPETAHMSAWSKKHGNPHRVDEINELKFPDAEFIAHAREDVPRLVKALRAVEAVHRNEHRDHLGRKSENPTKRGGFCYVCGWYGGATCPMITAIREALG